MPRLIYPTELPIFVLNYYESYDFFVKIKNPLPVVFLLVPYMSPFLAQINDAELFGKLTKLSSYFFEQF